MRKRMVVAIALVASVMLASSPAHANWLSTQWRWTYKTGGYCVKNYAEISHDATYRGGTHQSAVEVWYKADSPFGSYDCLAHEEARLKARVRAWKWDGEDWVVCRDSLAQTFQASFRRSVWLRYAQAPCGPAYYSTDGGGWAYVSSDWKGGWVAVWSYSDPWFHWLPE